MTTTVKKIKVKGIEISLIEKHEQDFISLTDMAKNAESEKQVENWLRNKNTLEFLAAWERLNNPNFNSLEFEEIRKEAGVNRFLMSVKQWVTRTRAIGINSRAGRHGSGTFAHRDIAFEFGMWISPEFKLLLIKEYQLLKEHEASTKNLEWDVRRLLTKVNYVIHTDSIKENIIPALHIPKENEWQVYADEADILNLAMFAKTAKQWRDENPAQAKSGKNIRDFADLHQLTVLANLETHNASMIKSGISQRERLIRLREIVERELTALRKTNYTLASIESPHYLQSKTDKPHDFGNETKT